MSDYRVYSLDGVGKLMAAEWVQAASNDEALALVRAMRKPMPCELWLRDRLVGKILEHPPADPSDGSDRDGT